MFSLRTFNKIIQNKLQMVLTSAKKQVRYFLSILQHNGLALLVSDSRCSNSMIYHGNYSLHGQLVIETSRPKALVNL